jgi:hypothetical protein
VFGQQKLIEFNFRSLENEMDVERQLKHVWMVWKNVKKKNRKSDENNGNKNCCNVNILTSSAASALGDNFSLGTLKNDFVALIYK